VAVGTKDLAVVMEPGQSISGVVNDADGRPIPQMSLQAVQVGGGNSSGNAYTDLTGRFVISGLASGEYRFEVTQWGGQNQGYVIETTQTFTAGSTDVRLVVGKGATITGVVVDEAGAVVPGGYVAASGKDKRRQAQPRGDGTFEIVGLDVGVTYRLDAQAQGRVNVRVDDVAAGARDVRIVLEKGLESSGRLCDAAGKPMASTHISFSRSAGGGNSQWVQTDATGRFSSTGFVDGVYEARVYVQKADGSGGDWKPVGTIKGGDRDADLRMPQ
jgi:hypothetical protein